MSSFLTPALFLFPRNGLNENGRCPVHVLWAFHLSSLIKILLILSRVRRTLHQGVLTQTRQEQPGPRYDLVTRTAGNKVKPDRLLSRRNHVLFGRGRARCSIAGNPDRDRVPITGNVVRVCLLMRAPHRAVMVCNSAANPSTDVSRHLREIHMSQPSCNTLALPLPGPGDPCRYPGEERRRPYGDFDFH